MKWYLDREQLQMPRLASGRSQAGEGCSPKGRLRVVWRGDNVGFPIVQWLRSREGSKIGMYLKAGKGGT